MSTPPTATPPAATEAPATHLLVSIETAQQIGAYLLSRPMGEVRTLVTALEASRPVALTPVEPPAAPTRPALVPDTPPTAPPAAPPTAPPAE